MTAWPARSTISASWTPTPLSKNTVEAALLDAGRLVLVVGPSGVGKDTLINGARATLAGVPAVVFARREITRPADAGGEDHLAVDPAVFRARAHAGGYLLSWEAHGLGYGLPAALGHRLASGATVVANVSRAVLDQARASFPRLRIVSIVASRDVVAARLAARGREDPEAVAARLARGSAFEVTGEDVVVVRNDGQPHDGVAALVAAIRS
jgi:phosphonate metabolism protein PhnN/1,5-bisphosphokinase (PRPP-forming)